MAYENGIILNVESASPHFTGRADLLDKVKSLVENKNTVAVTGFGGIGKSQFVKKYVEFNREHYNIIVWIDAEKNLKSQFLLFGKVLTKKYPSLSSIYDLQVEPFEYVRDILSNIKDPWLVVFDNVDNYEFIKNHFANINHTRGHMLITSRNNNGWPVSIKVEKLSAKESRLLLNKVIKHETDDNLEKLSILLDGYPLSIIQSSSFINNYPSMNIESYIKIYNEQKNFLIEKEGSFVRNEKFISDYDLDISAVVELTSKALEVGYPESFQLLKMITFMGSKNLSQVFLKNYASTYSATDIDELEYPLLKYSFISELFIEGDKNFSIHDSIKEYIKSNIQIEERRELISTGIRIMYNTINLPRSKLIDYLNSNPELVHHTETLINNAILDHVYSTEMIYLKMLLLEYYFSGTRDYAKGQTLMADIDKDLSTEDKNINIENKIRFFTNKVNYYMWSAEYKLAEKVGLDTANLMKINKLTGEDYSRLLVYIAYVYSMQGDSVNALKTLAELNFDNNPDKQPYLYSIYLYVKAGVLMDTGDLNKALELAKECIRVSQQNNFAYSSYYHREILKLFLLNSLGAIEESLVFGGEVKKKFDNIKISPKHETFARLLIGLVQTKLETGVVSESEVMDLKKSIKILDSWYKQNYHRNQALAHLVLAKIYVKMHDYQNSLAEYIVAENLYEKTLSNKSINEVSELYYDLVILGFNLNDRSLSKKYYKLLLKNFGYEYPTTVKLLKYINANHLSL